MSSCLAESLDHSTNNNGAAGEYSAIVIL
jgi:hypothetical protein